MIVSLAAYCFDFFFLFETLNTAAETRILTSIMFSNGKHWMASDFYEEK